MKNHILYYSVGALLYCPANKTNIAKSIMEEKFGTKFSLALCLEDAINDQFVEEAEAILIHSLQEIYRAHQAHPFFLPKIFIRVRNAGQMARLVGALGDSLQILTGFILPKFCPENAKAYVEAAICANESASNPLYIMPIYESAAIVNLQDRAGILYELKNTLSPIQSLVLNIRVGGNDLCNLFGFRRHSDESIHRIGPVANIFSDIITVYGMDYVVSGPVWEYYSGAGWQEGLCRELADDRLCGFIGKTVIHPNQIPVVNEAYKVTQADLQDARQILGWDQSSNSYVSGNQSKERMNEYKTHSNWARQTLLLAEAFGIKEG